MSLASVDGSVDARIAMRPGPPSGVRTHDSRDSLIKGVRGGAEVTMERDDRLGREMTRFLRDWSRRDFLRRTGQAGAVLAAGGGLAAVLEACGTGGGGGGGGTSSTVNTTGLPNVPAVPSDVVSVAKKYSGKTVVV